MQELVAVSLQQLPTHGLLVLLPKALAAALLIISPSLNHLLCWWHLFALLWQRFWGQVYCGFTVGPDW